ncbi:MAG: L-seryl-tRNA(Sec) selenium transferase, partial [Caldilineaceae bacterium]|nr:L-seryl-tRNA(Sec) selenium transferase [Caldilineaceae bacterium]
ATEEIPVWQMIAAPLERISTRAKEWQTILSSRDPSGERFKAEVWPGESAIGGGSLPGETLPSALLAIAAKRIDQVAERLRAADPPVICRIQQDHLLFDPRTVLVEQEEGLVTTLTKELMHG